MNLSDRRCDIRRSDAPTDSPACDRIGFRHRIHNDGPLSHSGQVRHADVFRRLFTVGSEENVLIDLVGEAQRVDLFAEIGVILLLFMLGLEYSGEELIANLKIGLPAGLMDFILNFPPGLLVGLLLGWTPLAALLLGGITYISSSGVIAKILAELGRLDNPETPVVISILVFEDFAMAVYLPLIAVLLIGQGLTQAILSILIALLTVGGVLFIAVRYGRKFSSFISHQSDEVTLFTTFGLILLVAGLAQTRVTPLVAVTVPLPVPLR